MSEINASETVFPFVCSNPDCNTSYDIKGFADVYILWGYIFLTSGDKCIIGLTCPECRQTSIKQYPSLPDDFTFKTFENIATNGNNNVQGPYSPGYYVNFSSEINPVQLDKNLHEDLYRVPSDFTQRIFHVESEVIPANINTSNFEAMMSIENNQNYKSFPRIIHLTSVYRLSDVWLKKINTAEVPSPEFLEECHNSLEILYTSGYNAKHDPNGNKKRYENLIQNDLTDEEFQDMDRDLYAWDTANFKNNIKEFLKTYRLMRNRKNFELICFNELINKYARIFYYQKGLKKDREFMLQAEYEDTAHLEPPEEPEEIVYDKGLWVDQGLESHENSILPIGELAWQCNDRMTTMHKFWYERLHEGTLSKDHNVWEKGILFQDLHNEYKEFVKSINYNHSITPQQFSAQLDKICKNIRTARVSREGKKCTVKFFPSLDDCRREFEQLLRMEGNIK